MNEERDMLFEDLCAWLEDSTEHGLHTLNEVYYKYCEMDQTDDKSLVYTKRYLKKKLEEKYCDNIYFTNEERRADILCFKDQTNRILRQHHEHLKQSPTDEKDHIIKTALKFICNDMKTITLNRYDYPSVEEMTNVKQQIEQYVPKSLQTLLYAIGKTDEKVAVWGQMFLRSYRPKSGVLPGTLGFALQLDHRYGSRWLTDKNKRCGYGESYAEVLQYKYCYLKVKKKYKSEKKLAPIEEEDEDEPDEDVNIEETDTSSDESDDTTVKDKAVVIEETSEDVAVVGSKKRNLEQPVNKNVKRRKLQPVDEEHTEEAISVKKETLDQYVADNLDMLLRSIYGNQSINIMGVMGVNGTPKTLSNTRRIPRTKLTQADKAALLKLGQVNIETFIDEPSKGIAAQVFKPLQELKEKFSPGGKMIPPSSGDILWLLGWLDPELENHPNWNGFMKSIHRDKTHKKSVLTYYRPIEGYPTDKSTVYTTLLECIRKSNGKAIDTTHDLPLWNRSLDVTLQKDLPALNR